jgi:hypothetical protein
VCTDPTLRFAKGQTVPVGGKQVIYGWRVELSIRTVCQVNETSTLIERPGPRIREEEKDKQYKVSVPRFDLI